MKPLIIALTILLTSFFSFCQSDKNDNYNEWTKESRSVEAFTEIKVENAIQVNITQGSQNTVVVNTSNTKDIKNVYTEVTNGILHIYLSKSKWNWKNTKIKVDVTLVQLNSIEASGACTVKIIDKILSDDLKIKLSGASDLKGEIKTINLDIETKGASDVNINGIASDANIIVSGASEFNGYNFNCENATLKASGASSISLSVVKKLSAEANGASSIDFKGSPEIIKSNSSGASSISKKS